MDNNIVYDASLDAEMEKRNVVEYIRDDSQSINVGDEFVGKIKSYKFKILIRDKPSLEGELSREEMDMVYNLYSAYGSDLQQRHVSRHFPNYTFQDFKRILRAFNITKASSPFAPHVIEEKSTEELITLTLQSKENDYLRRFEQDRNKRTEILLKEKIKENFELKNKFFDLSEFLSSTEFKVSPVTHKYPKQSTNSTLIVYLSDMHIGADVSPYSIYDNKFDLNVARERLSKVTNKILNTSDLFNATKVVICNLGDSIDGYNGETTRGGHKLPQNMDNKDQYKNFITLMLEFFADLSDSGRFDSISYISVDGGNHDGDVGFMVNKSLEACLSVLNSNIEVRIFEKFIEYFTIENHTFILSHGKDARDMFKNMPLTINDKYENQINEFIDYNNLTGKIHFIKGDLHQSATTYAKRFRYKSVSSFFGSSEWIHKNFGNTKPAVDFDIIDGDSVYESRLIL